MDKKIPGNEAYDALHKIKKTEEKAREIIQEAREKTASQIIQSAYDEAEKIKEQFLAEAKAKADKKKEEIISRARAEKDRIENESDKEISDLRQKTQPLMSSAAKEIRKKVEEALKRGTF
jgi:vacuolar-type H+-ATPase subunit H